MRLNMTEVAGGLGGIKVRQTLNMIDVRNAMRPNWMRLEEVFMSPIETLHKEGGFRRGE